MGFDYTVAQGDHLSKIAADNGFSSYATIWNHPRNLTLKNTRKNPNLLLPGDVVFIPDKDEDKVVTVPAGALHRFILHSSPLRLRLRLNGLDGNPLVATACTLALDGKLHALTSDASGFVETDIPASAEIGSLTVGDLEWSLQVGFLDPVEQRSGLEGRLVNLGLYAGQVGDGDDEQLRFAIELFQAQAGMPVTGEADPDTLARLQVLHGC